MPTSNEKLLASVGHLSYLLGLPVFVPLCMYLWQRDKSVFVTEQSKQAILLHLTVVLFYFIGTCFLFLTFGIGFSLESPFLVTIPFAGLIAVSIVAFWLSVIAVLKVANGRNYRYPLIGHLLDGV